MTQLYRITYLRAACPCSVTFSAADAVDAAEFSALWEQVAGLPVLTLVPLGPSKILSPSYRRARPGVNPGKMTSPGDLPPLKQDSLSPEESFQLEVSNER